MDWTSIGYLVGLFIVAFIAALIGFGKWIASHYTHPPLKGPTKGAGHKIIAEEKALGWTTLANSNELTFDFEGLVTTTDPEAVKHLLQHRAHSLTRSWLYRAFANFIPCCDGLLFMADDMWKRHHKALTPVFQGGFVAQYASVMHEHASSFAETWSAGNKPADLLEGVRHIGLANLMHWALGLQHHGTSGLTWEIALTMHQFSKCTFERMPAAFKDSLLSGLKQYAQLWRLGGKLRTQLRTVIESKAYNETGNPNALSVMVDAGWGEKEITSTVNHIHGAHKAIALVMTCGLFELSKRPKWQDRLRAEAEVVLASPGRTHTRAHLVREDITEGRLPDTLRFMREVVRRYPVSLGVLRSLGQDVTIGDNTYKKGMEILIPLYALHHSEKLWHRPMEFDPDRFGAANSVSVGALPVEGYPQPYFPFLDGQRRCAGMYLAELQFVMTIHAIIGKYDLTSTRPELSLRAEDFTAIDGPVPFNIQRRT